MPVRGTISLVLLLSAIFVFQSCKQTKEETTSTKVIQASSPTGSSPGTFIADIEVLDLNKVKDSVTQVENIKARVVAHAIKARGQALISVVAAGDTIICSWPAAKTAMQEIDNSIKKKQLIRATIREYPAMNQDNGPMYSIESFQLQ